ncbi:hypothetical protein P4O66_018584, partial [Electrophorus voltai]
NWRRQFHRGLPQEVPAFGQVEASVEPMQLGVAGMRGKPENRGRHHNSAYINEVLREVLGRSVVAYIDNILIYSSSLDQHVHDIWAVRCTLLQEVQTREVFIKSFSTLARPLTDLLCGMSKRIRWNSGAEKSFTELKVTFSTAPVLQQLDPEKPFVVEVDASDVGIGAVLSEHKGEAGQLKPIAYFSKKLSPAERNCHVGDYKLLAMKLAFEEWKHWLEGA